METLNNTYKSIDQCLCCGSNLQIILDLGNHPPANSYLKTQDEQEYYFPLKLNYCNRCTHLQLSHAVDPDILFKNYLYVSGTTITLKRYFESFVNLVTSHKNKPNLKILDIACNDGSQLDAFKSCGHLTYGVDPAVNLYDISSKNHNIVCDYFTEDSVSKFGTKFDVIIAQNVFAHNSYPKEFLLACKKYLEDDGIIFIQTSQADMIKYKQFDTIYHEHISFFSPLSMKTLVNSVGLYLNEVLKTDIHGNSYVFIISNLESENELVEDNLNLDTVKNFAKSVDSTIENLKNQINHFKNAGYMIVGYGAAAKGNTVLNYGKIELDYIVDDNPLKQGLYTPGMKIPIVSLDFIKSIGGDIAWLPLSWNFFDEIKQKIIQSRPNKDDRFIKINFTN